LPNLEDGRDLFLRYVRYGAADSALAAADLLGWFNQSRIIFIAPGGPKNVIDLCFGDRRGPDKTTKWSKTLEGEFSWRKNQSRR
jgi:hypothetical protein